MFTVVTCGTKILLATDLGASGSLSFTLTETMEDTSTGEIVAPVPIVVNLDKFGALQVNLIANDDPTTITASGNAALYNVVGNITGQPEESYQIKVPRAAASSLAQLAALRVV